jgi:hypothetical protein
VALEVMDDLGAKAAEDADPDQDDIQQEEIAIAAVMAREARDYASAYRHSTNEAIAPSSPRTLELVESTR